MLRSWILAPVVAALLVPISHGADARPPDVVWSRPEMLVEGDLMWLAAPSVAVYGQGLYIAGTLVDGSTARPTALPPRPADARTVVLFKARGQPTVDLGLPAYDARLGEPRIGVTSDGVLHMLWSEVDSAATRDVEPAVAMTDQLFARGIWYAQYSGGRWSAPQRVHSGPTYYWRGTWTGPLITDGTRLHLVVGTPRRDSSRNRMVYIRIDSGGVHAVDIAPRLTGWPKLFSVVPGGNGLVDIYYVDGLVEPGLIHDRGSVLVMRSRDDGRTWSPQRRLYLGGDSAVRWMRATESPDRKTVTVLLEQATGLDSTVWRRITSSDGGDSWSAPSVVASGGSSLIGSTMSADACHDLVLTLVPGGTLANGLAIVRGGGLTPIAGAVPTGVASTYALAMEQPDLVHAVWTQLDGRRSQVEYAVGKLQRDCARPAESDRAFR